MPLPASKAGIFYPIDLAPACQRLIRIGVTGSANGLQPQSRSDTPDFCQSNSSPAQLSKVVHPTGFEPVTPAFGGQYSIQLSYGCLALSRVR